MRRILTATLMVTGLACAPAEPPASEEALDLAWLGVTELQERMESVRAENRKMDEKLDRLMDEMHAAKRRKKTEAMEAVIDELVRQRRKTRAMSNDVEKLRMDCTRQRAKASAGHRANHPRGAGPGQKKDGGE